MKRHGRRRKLVINKKTQSRIILAISWPSTACLVFTSVLLGMFCMRLASEALELDAELPSIVPVFLTSLGFICAAAVFLLFSALKFSHRIAGPMYRVKKTLQAVRNGDLAVRARLRKHDFLYELADDVNEFLDWLEEHPPEGVERVEAAGDDRAAAPSAEPAETAG